MTLFTNFSKLLPPNITNLVLVPIGFFEKNFTSKWDHIVFVFLHLTYFTQYNALRTYLCCQTWQVFLLFYGWIIFHCGVCVCVCVCVCVFVCVCIFFIHLLFDGHFGCFHALPTINNFKMIMEGQISLQDSDFISFR